GTDPRVLALLAVAYAAAMLIGMARYGIDAWSARADTFGVVFGLAATLSPVELRDGVVRLRRPLSGATGVLALPGTAAVPCAVVGATAYEGLRTTALWTGDLHPALRATLSETAAATAGLLAITALVGVVYRLGTLRAGATRFAHSLIPIAGAYVLAHELTLLLFQGQAAAALASDPLGLGSDLLGTATWTPDFGLLGDGAIWSLEIALVVGGHVAALALAHDRALVAEDGPARAARTQLPVLAVMVGFTSLALWLLASINA
ncbi:MAG: fenitrothion hydrolase, partial [Solirubrobacteraceae bacterium]